MSLIYEVEEKPAEVNGYFERKFKWKVSQIAQQEYANGYIVQRIIRHTEASENFLPLKSETEAFCHTYFEAWKVQNGIIVYPAEQQYEFDDRWLYNAHIPSFDAMLNDCAEKYLTSGCITMIGEVYWLEASDERIAILESRFKMNNKDTYAGELLSAETFEELHETEKIDTHSFHASWDFSTESKFVDAICEIYEKRDISSEIIQQDIQEHFSKLPVYSKLLRRIIKNI